MCDLVLCSFDGLMFWELNTQRNEVVNIKKPLQHWEGYGREGRWVGGEGGRGREGWEEEGKLHMMH